MQTTLNPIEFTVEFADLALATLTGRTSALHKRTEDQTFGVAGPVFAAIHPDLEICSELLFLAIQDSLLEVAIDAPEPIGQHGVPEWQLCDFQAGAFLVAGLLSGKFQVASVVEHYVLGGAKLFAKFAAVPLRLVILSQVGGPPGVATFPGSRSLASSTLDLGHR